MNRLFKLFFLSLIFMFVLGADHAYTQQNHFVYIQADDKQAFNVTVNGKTYTSSDIGYVIIPKLTDGKYRLSISFPDDKYPAQDFSCAISKSDAGYALKNLKDKGWALFNFQTLEVTLAGKGVEDQVKAETDTAKAKTEQAKEQAPPPDTAKPNAFGEMLSDVMNDSSLKKAAIDLQEKEKQRQAEALAAERQKVEQAKKQPASFNDSVLSGQPGTSPVTVVKIAQYSTAAGTSMVFVDKTSGDTVRIFLPKEQEVARNDAAGTGQQPADSTSAVNTSDSAVQSQPDTSTVTEAVPPPVGDTVKAVTSPTADSSANIPTVAENKNEKKNDLTAADTTVASSGRQPNNPFYKGTPDEQMPADSATQAAQKNVEPDKTNAVTSEGVKNDCKKMFADEDLDRVKKKMISASTDEKMIQTAKKYFEDKCVTTDQVKNLSGLFLTDDGRYHFFEAVFRNVYDVSRFPSLESQLIDPYYKKRFNAMLK